MFIHIWVVVLSMGNAAIGAGASIDKDVQEFFIAWRSSGLLIKNENGKGRR